MEHDCTTKDIVPGLIVSSDGGLDTPQAVEDWCICSSLHVHGNSVNVHYYHCCPVHNDTLKHTCTHNNLVTGQSNFAQFDELPETIRMPQSRMLVSVLHYTFRETLYTNATDVQFITTLEHNCTLRNTVIGRGS